jgi:hypothetical protein
MKRLVYIIALFLASEVSALALDAQLSTEVDTIRGTTVVDVQAQVGQRFDVYRVYVQGELTKETSLLPNSNQIYRLGIEDNHFTWLKVEAGVGSYKSQTFFFGKATASWDSANK